MEKEINLSKNESLGLEQKVKAVVDTNVLMNIDCLNFLKKFIEEGNKLIVPITVAQEIDKLNHLRNEEVKYKARVSLRFIRDFKEQIQFDLSAVIEDQEIMSCLKESQNDGLIIESAIRNKAKLITLDLTMELLAEKLGVETLKIVEVDDSSYKGYRIIDIDSGEREDTELFASLFEYPSSNPLNLVVNEYVIVRDRAIPVYDDSCDNIIKDRKTVALLKYDGEKLNEISVPYAKYINIEPLSDLQACALDMLNDDTIPIRILAGVYGSGKSFLATRSALYQVEREGNYGKIVLVRNNDMAGKDVGALPGDINEKTDILFQTIAQHMPMGEAQFEQLRKENKLGTYVSYFIKGADIGGYVIVDEAEDLTMKDIKKIGSRINELGCVNFLGDWNQTEGKYVSTSGLIDFIAKTKDNPLVSVMVLDEDVRSDTSKVFADL